MHNQLAVVDDPVGIVSVNGIPENHSILRQNLRFEKVKGAYFVMGLVMGDLLPGA
jgi:hypothetical protein